MLAILHNISRSDDGLIRLSVSIGAQSAREYCATYQRDGPTCVSGNLEQELFMALSNLAYRRFGNCVVYHHELMKLMGAFCNGEPLPAMPFALGTSKFCTMRPSRARIVWNKARIALHRVGLFRPRIDRGRANG